LKLQLVEPKIDNFSVEPILDLGLDEQVSAPEAETSREIGESPDFKRMKI